jgi:hypothetical protein
MRNVLLIDVALWGVLIIMAALIIIQRWRRSHSRLPVRRPRWEAPEPAGQKMPAPQPARRTGPGAYRTEPAGATPRPARPPQAAPTQAAPPQAVSPSAVRPPAAQLAGPRARPYQPGAQREDRQPPARAATPGERIASYYDQADQPIADYLAARGWTEPPATPPIGQHAVTRALPQYPQTSQPASTQPASTQLAPSQPASGTGTRQDGRQGRGQQPPRLAGSR